jgi:phage-related protein
MNSRSRTPAEAGERREPDAARDPTFDHAKTSLIRLSDYARRRLRPNNDLAASADGHGRPRLRLGSMPHTQSVYYRDQDGREPVAEFTDGLPAKRAAKIDAYVAQHLNGRDAASPPPEHPITSQIDGELRELRIRFANTRYRLLYQRSGNLNVLLHGFEKDTGAVSAGDIALAKGRMADFTQRMDAAPRRPPRAVGRDAPTPRRAPEAAL